MDKDQWMAYRLTWKLHLNPPYIYTVIFLGIIADIVVFIDHRAPGPPPRLPALCLHESSYWRREEEPASGPQEQVRRAERRMKGKAFANETFKQWYDKEMWHVSCINLLCMCVSTRFTELYVEELENEGDLRILVSDYLKCLNPNRNIISGIIRLDS